MAIDVDSIKAAYAAGILTRDRLTGYSPVDMKEVLNRIYQMVKNYQKMEDERFKEVDYFIVGGSDLDAVEMFAGSDLDAVEMFAEARSMKEHHDKWLAEQEAQAAEQEVEPNNEEE